ncbi:hypothetical protein VA596_25785 [Amycolatopsis sp., V23-08]|uniref:Secreted protein n=1 Tax=Amycolatopsis heterodermiae TaxID=3110235 RepID=A0ABU5R9P1_9PSEU|nr:hypothetical protein [Amycolatopsis sp., V23-08]MEA5362967.1 hypothetical protein [Amycolatopsis sp., V23-08]
MTHFPKRRALVPVACLAFLLAASPVTYADSPSSGGDVTVAQTLGDRELTVVLRRITSVPGPLHLDVVTHAGTAPGRLTVAARATAESGAPATAAVDLGAEPRAYSAVVTVDRPGPWELALGDGTRTARIPFVVPVQVISPPERLVYGGFLAAGVLLLVSVVTATRTRRTAWAVLPAGGMVAGLAVAVTAAVLSASLPLPPQPGPQLDPTVANVTDPYALTQPMTGDYSRPPVVLTVDGAPAAGHASDLGLTLTDGSTGLPADDLVVHDSALVHLLLIGPDGELWHEHPIRTAPGHYALHVTPPMPGHYALSVELVRRGGGVQLVHAAAGIDVTGTSASPAVPAPVRLGAGQLTGVTVPGGITVTTTTPAAGEPTTVTARAGDTGDLQPWLGMAGHLIVAGPLPPTAPVGAAAQTAPVWAHVHAMGSTSTMDPSRPGIAGLPPVNGDSAPDETVAAYGPDVPFTYTFPVPGRYRLWIQVERRYAVLTVPVVLDVAPAPRETP